MPTGPASLSAFVKAEKFANPSNGEPFRPLSARKARQLAIYAPLRSKYGLGIKRDQHFNERLWRNERGTPFFIELSRWFRCFNFV